MNLNIIRIALLCLLAVPGFAQQAYWQQQVDNDISVTLDDKTHFLNGHISIRYQNNAPDTLTFIYFHLYPNAYSTDRTAFEKQMVENGNTKHYFSSEEERGYIDSLQFRVGDPDNGAVKARYVATMNTDIIRLILPEPLPPGAHVTIETPFRVKLPYTFSRMGHNGQSYQVSQWFPKPAVYDAKGWHPIPYLDQGEFYSEYGSYRVAVTLPRNYIVMGTGNIMEEGERTWLDSLAALPAPAAQVRKLRPYVKDTVQIPSAAEMKTVTFEEQNIHDFAWFADKQWVVRKDTVAVPGSGNVVTAYTCYLSGHQSGWGESIQSVKTAIREYSKAVGPYPYKTVKAVEGALSSAGGMEYPTVTIIAATDNKTMVNTAIVHEVGHNWFYGMLGSNERKYPWMDEGINSFYEHRFAPTEASLTSMGTRDDAFLAYASVAATHDLVPADTAADVIPELNYGTDIYAKFPYLLQWLEGYMGQEKLDAAMKEYFQTWQYRHPQPEDFEKIVRKHTDQNLDWFFKDAIKTNKPVDFAIRHVNKNGYTIVNRTNFPAPVQVVFYQGKDSVWQWIEPFTGSKRLDYELSDSYSKIKIGDVIPDYNTRNNESRSPLSLRPFLGLNLAPKTKLWYAPAIGYNYYDGFMAGILLHNFTLPQNRFQFALAPLYGFGSKTIAGTGLMGYTFYFDEGWLHDIQVKLEGKTFSFDKTNMNISSYLHTRYSKVAPELIFNIRKPSWRSTVERTLSLKGYWIREEGFAFNMNPYDSLYYPSKGGYEDNFYGRLRYEHRNTRTFNPFSYTLEGQAGKQFAKISLEANLRIDYFRKNKALYIRGYAGKFFSFSDNEFDSYRYRIANTYSGQNDYLYDETYIGRNEQTGLWSQQISMKEGGFKVNTLQYASQLGLSDNWLFALNIKSDIPFWNLPVRLFVDVATFSDAKQNNPSGATVLYEAGVEVYISDYFSVYLPLLLSKDFSEYTKSVYPENRFLKTISFSLNLGRLNWMQLPAKILKL